MRMNQQQRFDELVKLLEKILSWLPPSVEVKRSATNMPSHNKTIVFYDLFFKTGVARSFYFDVYEGLSGQKRGIIHVSWRYENGGYDFFKFTDEYKQPHRTKEFKRFKKILFEYIDAHNRIIDQIDGERYADLLDV